MTTLRTLLITASSLAVTAASTSAFAQETPDATGSELRQSEVVVTGTRTANRTSLETAVPVDVFPVEELTETGRVELNQILSTTVPSFNFNQTAINDGTDIIRPATLRGLSPDQTLVLVNGKRRHITALVNINGSVGRGSAAVDLNSIPTSAIGNVQVLRDGASAQYGSDAIAGVINVILREADHGGGVNIRYGAHVTDPEGLNRSEVDGQTTNVGGWAGFGLGENGFLTVSGDYSLRQRSNRAGIDPRQQFPDDPAYAEAERSFDRLNHVYGNGRMANINFFLNSGYTLNNGVELYAFGGVQEREAESPGFYRRASDSRNVPEIYPGGFLPVIGGDVSDYSLGGGVRGEAGLELARRHRNVRDHLVRLVGQLSVDARHSEQQRLRAQSIPKQRAKPSAEEGAALAQGSRPLRHAHEQVLRRGASGPVVQRRGLRGRRQQPGQ